MSQISFANSYQEFSDRPIPLVTYSTSQRQFIINPEAIDFLRSIPAPISIVGVAGLYRTGKSFLLNRVLLDRKEGFDVGSTVNACTKGLWLWGRPIKGKTNKGQDCNIIILDSEGIGAMDEDIDHDTRVFALAVLISSYFLYNSLGSIDEEALQSLSLVVNLTQHIQIKAGKKDQADAEDYAEFFPSFVWIVRDFSLQLVDKNGDAISPNQYLENILEIQKGYSDSAEEKNRIRRLLKNFFKNRDCFCLVRPVQGERELQNLSNIDNRRLRPEFLEQMNQLRQFVLFNTQPKGMYGQLLNGEMLADLVQSYITAINSGAIPTIENAWTYICKNECGKAVRESLYLYESLVVQVIQDRFPIEPQALKQAHIRAKDEAFKQFQISAFGGGKDQYREELISQIRDKYQEFKQENIVQAEKKFDEFCKENYKIIDQKFNNGEYNSYLEFERELRQFQQYFLQHGPEGPNKINYVLQFLNKQLQNGADFFIRKQSTELEYRLQEAQDKVGKFQQQYEDARQQKQREIEMLQSELAIIQSERSENIIKETSLRQQYELIKQEKDKVENQLREQIKQIRNESNNQIEQANQKCWDAEDRLKDMQRENYVKQSELIEQIELQNQKIKYLQENIEDYKKRESEYIQLMKNQKEELNESMKQNNQKYSEQVQQLKKQLLDESEKIIELEKNLADKQFEQDKLSYENSAVIQTLKTQISSLEQYLDTVKAQNKQLQNSKQQLETQLHTSQSQLSQMEKNFNQPAIVEEIKPIQVESISNQDKLFYETKINFLQKHLQQARKQVEEEREGYIKMLDAVHQMTQNNMPVYIEDIKQQLSIIREQYAQDIRDIDYNKGSEIRKLAQLNEEIQQRFDQLEVEFKLKLSEWQNKEFQLNDKIIQISHERDQVRQRLEKIMNDQKLDEIRLSPQRYSSEF